MLPVDQSPKLAFLATLGRSKSIMYAAQVFDRIGRNCSLRGLHARGDPFSTGKGTKVCRMSSRRCHPELAATARGLGRKPAPRLIEISERPMPGGPTVYLIGLHESGKTRLTELRMKLAAEQR